MVKKIKIESHEEKGIITMEDFNFLNIRLNCFIIMELRSSVFINCILDNFLRQVVHERIRNSALLNSVLVNNVGIVGVRVDEN